MGHPRTVRELGDALRSTCLYYNPAFSVLDDPARGSGVGAQSWLRKIIDGVVFTGISVSRVP